MKKDRKIWVVLLIIMVIAIAGIIYYRTDLFQTKPKDDRKSVSQLKDGDGKSAKVIGIYSEIANLHVHKSENGQMQAKISGKMPKQDNVELKWIKRGQQMQLNVIYKINDLKAEKEAEQDTTEEEKQKFSAQLNLDVSIPSKFYDAIELHTKGGNLLSDIPLSASEIEVNTGAGSANLANISGDQVHFKADDEGNIQLKNVKAGYMTLTSWDGNQSLQGYQGGNIKFEAQGGDINLSQITGGMMTLKTESGNMKIDQIKPSFLSYELWTESGNVDFTFHTIPTNLYLALTSESGKMKNNLPIKKIIDKDADYYQKRYIKGTLGNGTGNVLIDTKKGNINVSLKK
ncbi:DUF4097 family beta strand repeat-containing protein [Shimazuella alba]|uniref:DUF4097 family beta strand repeat protein n=1 Tax=Shimazuella alba TaxID=2690964 RepID=A0A6I4VXX2_9BACL|nr:DUF4097 family beta strand repeat-containing protein [Shimazuella alba]MXQ55713.1 DUF4097 family beta strand repeat protein [Shimazuella alba]